MISSRNRRRRFVTFHADLFAENVSYNLQVKPLTEEEREQKLAELRAKLAEKRSRKAEEAAKEQMANETIRRKSGKVGLIFKHFIICMMFINFGVRYPNPKEMNQFKEDLKVKQALKEAEQKKKGNDDCIY
jgi:hypothetical protein